MQQTIFLCHEQIPHIKNSSYGSGHEDAQVLLPGFAVIW